MTIQRQYSLPNCKLVIDGLSNAASDEAGGRPLLSMVTNVECHFAGYDQPLAGGREFLESLVTTVSDYAQEYLSGIHHLVRRDRHHQYRLVQLQRLNVNLHRLTIEPQVTQDQPLSATPAQLDLTTVQLFDLVEAVDQFFADAQTLPELALKLSPLPKRAVLSQEPMAKRAAPAALGLSGLAVAAIALFFVPAPQVRRPEPAGTTTQQGSTASPSPIASASPPSPTSSPKTSPEAVASTSTASPTTGAAASPGLDAVLAGASEITDPTQLQKLNVELYDKLDQAWRKTPTFSENLVYRVAVASSGEVQGYKFVNDAALKYLDDVPLADLRFNSTESTPEGSASSPSPTASPTNSPTSSSPTSTGSAAREPIAQFRVVFKPDGVLEVSPWYGTETGSSAPATSGAGTSATSSPSSTSSGSEPASSP
jgi:hypothetical protein